MDKIQKCAKSYENLFDKQYSIIIGRNVKTVELVIGFSKLDFHHLMGLRFLYKGIIINHNKNRANLH